MTKNIEVNIRLLESRDIPEIAAAFQELGWHKPASLYEHYLHEQEFGDREVYIAFVNGRFAGYVTICWKSAYEPFRSQEIPEIVDFNVLPAFRRMGIGTNLMDRVESEIAKASPVAGIGVGMDPDYGAAQRLYVLRGYVPDGLGLYWKDHHVRYDEEVRVDYDLALYFIKVLQQT